MEQAVEYFRPKVHRRELWYVRAGGGGRQNFQLQGHDFCLIFRIPVLVWHMNGL